MRIPLAALQCDEKSAEGPRRNGCGCAVPAEDSAIPASGAAVPAEDPAVPAEDPALPVGDSALPAEDPAVPDQGSSGGEELLAFPLREPGQDDRRNGKRSAGTR